ncbi:hypothetical protein OE88DRAFT_1645287 [Heliocybe sulcata]|uniref:Uncharacterized protein n=1 Tax=Heliocybe sulcata TaxID=5364 RepID=A0A5C3NB30_9AGAM|nr:hypothetical protein OE88DRAFT_1645287 [Heliocybe sulcata]
MAGGPNVTVTIMITKESLDTARRPRSANAGYFFQAGSRWIIPTRCATKGAEILARCFLSIFDSAAYAVLGVNVGGQRAIIFEDSARGFSPEYKDIPKRAKNSRSGKFSYGIAQGNGYTIKASAAPDRPHTTVGNRKQDASAKNTYPHGSTGNPLPEDVAMDRNADSRSDSDAPWYAMDIDRGMSLLAPELIEPSGKFIESRDDEHKQQDQARNGLCIRIVVPIEMMRSAKIGLPRGGPWQSRIFFQTFRPCSATQTLQLPFLNMQR